MGVKHGRRSCVCFQITCCRGAVVVTNSRSLFHRSIKFFSPNKDAFVSEKRAADTQPHAAAAALRSAVMLSRSEVFPSKQTHGDREEGGGGGGGPVAKQQRHQARSELSEDSDAAE